MNTSHFDQSQSIASQTIPSRHEPQHAHREHGRRNHGTVSTPTHAQHHGGGNSSPARLASSATLHCLVGCAVGEFIGLAIGVSLGLDAWTTMSLATALGFLSGYALGLLPLVKTGMSWLGAFRTIWLGETISITVMELVMNFTDCHVGGVQATSIFAPMFRLGFVHSWPEAVISSF